MADLASSGQRGLRDHHDVLEVGPGRVGEDGQFGLVEILGVVAPLTLGEAHPALPREHIGAELADEQHDDADMRQQDA